MKNVVVAGATGLVGSAVVAQLKSREDVTVRTLTRQDFAGDLSQLTCDVLISCLGTTIRKAGSQAAFRAVDHELPERLVQRLVTLPNKPGFALVSSVGASPRGNFYLRTKFETEELVRKSGLPYLIVRPSVLDGHRAESRPLERTSLALFHPLAAGLERVLGRARWLGLYKPILATQVARTLIRHAVDRSPSNETLEGWDLYDP